MPSRGTTTSGRKIPAPLAAQELSDFEESFLARWRRQSGAGLLAEAAKEKLRGSFDLPPFHFKDGTKLEAIELLLGKSAGSDVRF